MDQTIVFYDDYSADHHDNDGQQQHQLENCHENVSNDLNENHDKQIQLMNELTRKFHQKINISNDVNLYLNGDNNNYNQQNHSIESMIHFAAMNNDLNLMKKLLSSHNNDNNIHSLINCLDSESNTPLLVAASNGHREMVQFLLDHGSLINAQNFFENTSLHEAAWKGFSETLEILCNYKPKYHHYNNNNQIDPLESSIVKLHLKNKQGHTALHLAAQKGHNQSTRVLLLAGCKPNVKNNFGDTPLHSASRYGHVGVCRILISAFANVNELNKNDDTALHIASAMDRKKLAKILLENGCNPTIVNRQGETPMNIALRKCYFDIQELIASPPPLKSMYRNHHSNNNNNSNGLWSLTKPIKNLDYNQHRKSSFDIYGRLKTKSDTYSYDQLNQKRKSIHNHKQHSSKNYHKNLNDDHDDDEVVVDDDPTLWPTNLLESNFKNLQRCKSEFSTNNCHCRLNIATTPTTQASSEYRNNSNKPKFRKKKVQKANHQSKGKLSSHNTISDHDHYNPYGSIGHHHHNQHYNSHHELTEPNLSTLPIEPLEKGEKYFMDLSGHIHKGPIINNDNNDINNIEDKNLHHHQTSKNKQQQQQQKSIKKSMLIINDNNDVVDFGRHRRSKRL